MIKIKFEKKNNKIVAYDNNIKVGECVFIETGEYWNIIHTQVNNLYQGQGIARQLIKAVIENAKIYNKKIKADCSYAKKILEMQQRTIIHQGRNQMQIGYTENNK